MLYTLLGRIVWKLGKWFVRRRYRSAGRPALALGALAVAGGVALLAARHASDDD